GASHDAAQCLLDQPFVQGATWHELFQHIFSANTFQLPTFQPRAEIESCLDESLFDWLTTGIRHDEDHGFSLGKARTGEQSYSIDRFLFIVVRVNDVTARMGIGEEI